MLRHTFAAVTMLGLFGCSTAGAADIELQVLSQLKAGTDTYRDPPTIMVAGRDGRYRSVQTGKLRFHLLSRVEFSKRFDRLYVDSDGGLLKIVVEGGDPAVARFVRLEAYGLNAYDARVTERWELHELEYQYQDPAPVEATRQLRDPVALCNDLLRSKSGDERARMLREGASFGLADAYRWQAHASIYVRRRGGVLTEKEHVASTGTFGVTIRCQNLEGPAPRTQATTRGADPRPGKPLAENSAITAVSLRIEPSEQRVETRAGQSCPTSLRLYGRVVAKREFTGRTLFFGSGYLTPLAPLVFDRGGERNIVAVYPIDWDVAPAPGAKAERAVPQASPSVQRREISLQLNVIDADGEVEATSGRQQIEVTCRPLRAPPPQPSPSIAPAVLTGTPGEADFDALLRRIQRGDASSVRVWVYNGGPGVAPACRVVLRHELDGTPGEAAHVLGELAPGSTVDHTFPLPRPVEDYAAMAAEVACRGEPAANTANNRAVLIPRPK